MSSCCSGPLLIHIDGIENMTSTVKIQEHSLKYSNDVPGPVFTLHLKFSLTLWVPGMQEECRIRYTATCGMPTLTAKTVFNSVWNSPRQIFRSTELYKKYTQILYSCYLFWARCHHELDGALFSCCWSGMHTLHRAVLEEHGANHPLSSLTRPTPACSFNASYFLQPLHKLVALQTCLYMMACKGGRRISSTWWWLRHWAILNFLGSSQELALSKYPGNCWVKKTQKSSQGVYIRAALRLILNIAKVKISPYSTSDRSSVRGYNHIHFYHASSFFHPLLCREKHPLSSQQIVSVNLCFN